MVTSLPSHSERGLFDDMLGVSAKLPAGAVKFDAGPRAITAAELDAAAALTADVSAATRLEEMADLVRQGGTVLPVDPELAHAQEIGRREIRRRRARRKARSL